MDHNMLSIPQSIRSHWEAELTSEIQFWDAWVRTKGSRWPDDYGDRCNPELPLQPRLAALLPSSPPVEANILDVGAGPLTYLGKTCQGKHVTITAVDPLADAYDIILDRYQVQPLVRTQKLSAEDLLTGFFPDTYDLVYARNCLDHAYDPERAVVQMIVVVKSGRYVVLEHRPHEGENANYSGLHQWDFSVSANGDFVISSRYTTVNMTKKYEALCTITCEIVNNGGNDNWLVTRIQKR